MEPGMLENAALSKSLLSPSTPEEEQCSERQAILKSRAFFAKFDKDIESVMQESRQAHLESLKPVIQEINEAA